LKLTTLTILAAKIISQKENPSSVDELQSAATTTNMFLQQPHNE
jgi:hypothetical protein